MEFQIKSLGSLLDKQRNINIAFAHIGSVNIRKKGIVQPEVKPTDAFVHSFQIYLIFI